MIGICIGGFVIAVIVAYFTYVRAMKDNNDHFDNYSL